MTRQEYTGKRDLFMSGWIRENLPDSYTGTRVTDMDFVLTNINHNKVLFVEVKQYNSKVKKWQTDLYNKIVDSIRMSGELEANYCEITFEKTNFEDGKVYLNGIEATEHSVKKYLSGYC